jgi:tetratricopeptide (TPR) repeat protein
MRKERGNPATVAESLARPATLSSVETGGDGSVAGILEVAGMHVSRCCAIGKRRDEGMWRAGARRSAHSPDGAHQRLIGVLKTILIAVGTTGVVRGQAPELEATGTVFDYQRRMEIPAGMAHPAVIVTEFFTQGALKAGAENVVVYDGRHRLVPWRVLQVGPGDLCRVAFQTVARQPHYRIEYGGARSAMKSPPWTSSAGLLMETRRFRPCNLDNVDSVQEAWDATGPFGGDYVPAVFHRYNPFAPEPGPFLSRYRGTLHIVAPGRYRFFTSSQDCSFLRIDGREVAAAPGPHGPVGDARFRGDVQLTAGPHSFEYIHAAGGPDACMVAAWQPPGAAKPEIIPARAFRGDEVGFLASGGLQHRLGLSQRDFTVQVVDEVPLADSALPLLRAQFRYVSARGVTTRPRVLWDFGDGQTSGHTNPQHIYLHPGLYVVTLSFPGDSGGSPTVNRVPIQRPVVLANPDTPAPSLSAYLPLLEPENPAKLDSFGVLQLLRALVQAGQPARAVKIGRVGLLAQRPAQDSESTMAAARVVGELLRDRLADPATALVFWRDLAGVVGSGADKAECEIEAADLALNVLLRAAEAKPLLDSATPKLASIERTQTALTSRLYRVRGDWYARNGDRPSARAAYARSMSAAAQPSLAEQAAQRGALSFSAEAFLRDGELDRARAELRRWQEEFPADRMEGYLSLLQAREQAARRNFERAIVMARDLIAVNPDSPYADRLAFLAAECEEQRGRAQAARAVYRNLITDYPGSPLVAAARQKLEHPERKPAESKAARQR